MLSLLLTIFCGLAVVIATTNANHPQQYPPFQPAIFCSSLQPWGSLPKRECYLANATWDADLQMSAAKSQMVSYMRSNERAKHLNVKTSVVVYIHAMVIGEQIAGLLILDKLLQAIFHSGLHQHASGIFVVGMGNTTHLPVVVKPYAGVRLITALSNLSMFYEFPTLALMQQHARVLPPTTQVLYLHTKGVTSLNDRIKTYMRDMMVQYNIYLHDQSIAALSAGYWTSGVLYIKSVYRHYGGNFLWYQARAIAQNTNVMDLIWRWRFGAEMWSLEKVPSCRIFAPEYTIKDFNHNMQLFESLLSVQKLRVNNISAPMCSMG